MTTIDEFKKNQKNIYSRKVNIEHLDEGLVYFEYPITLQALKKIKFLKRLNFSAEYLFLDIGCYQGDYSRYLNKTAGIRGVGIDISQSCVNYSRKADSGKNLYVVADAEDLPFKDEIFGGVLFISSLEHSPDPKKSISEAFRVLKREEVCLLHQPVRDFKYTLQGFTHRFNPLEKNMSYQEQGHYYEKILSAPELLLALREAGFSLISSSKQGMFIQPLHDWYIMPFLSEAAFKYLKEFFSSICKIFYRKEHAQNNVVSSVDHGKVSIFRKIYSRAVLPILEKLDFLERLLTGSKFGYCVYVSCKKN